MTLGGLALAVGILVDEATVVDREHPHAARCGAVARPRGGRSRAQNRRAAPAGDAVHPGGVRAVVLHGRGRRGSCSCRCRWRSASRWSPPTCCRARWCRCCPPGCCARRTAAESGSRRLRISTSSYLSCVLRFRWPLVGGVRRGRGGCVLSPGSPDRARRSSRASDAGQFQLRLRAPTGTRIERTELLALQGPGHHQAGSRAAETWQITTGFVGVQPASYPINTIYLWTSGPHEAVLRVALKPGAPAARRRVEGTAAARASARSCPDAAVSFEAGDIVSQVMSFGSPTPIEVAVQGPNLPANRAHAAKICAELGKIPVAARSAVRAAARLPDLDVDDRPRARRAVRPHHGGRGALAGGGHVLQPLHRSQLTGAIRRAATRFRSRSRSRRTRWPRWRTCANLPVMTERSRPATRCSATSPQLRYGTAPGEVDRYNMQRVVSLTANIHGAPLGGVADEVQARHRAAGQAAAGRDRLRARPDPAAGGDALRAAHRPAARHRGDLPAAGGQLPVRSAWRSR